MPSKLRAPVEPGELGRIIQKIYDDFNSIIDSINTELKGLSEPTERAKEGSIAVSKEGSNSYSLRGKTADGWAKVGIRLLNSEGIELITSNNKFTNSDDISNLTDSTGGTISATIANTTGVANNGSDSDAVTKVTEFENAVASLNSKIKENTERLNLHNDRLNTVIDKMNTIINRLNNI